MERRRSSARSISESSESSRAASESTAHPPKRKRVESDGDDSRAGRKALLGENIGGRSNVVSDKNFRDNNPALRGHKGKKDATQLEPVKVELHTEANREAHNTDFYEVENLILRRGQKFQVTVIFDRSFDSSQDDIFLQFVCGSRPQQSKKSLIRVAVAEELTTSQWGMKIIDSSEKNMELSVMSPVDAIVGGYTLFVETKTKDEGSNKKLNFRMEYPDRVYMLFNAWCKDDAVYMANEDDRQEYVLNDHGRIWVGSARSFTSIPWNFGQFEEVSLETSLHLLDKAEIAAAARANPVRVTRVISQMANYNDRDGGILYGRWTESYPKNSTRPTAWTGSVAICEKYARRHYMVRYGQCWVFSGLVTTLLRALGIPTRSVTNFESAHDTDASMTIDFHCDEEGKPMEDLNDSVWNFHVWNESYFARQDLPEGYDGWQAHDATPQETSEGVFRCGPCPVKAIKRGEVHIPYDGGFIFAEVNGDKVYWDVDDEGEMEVSYVAKRSIGMNISTKAVGSNARHDLTHDYKFPEGTPEERRAVYLANRYSSRKDEEIYKPSQVQDVKFSAEVDCKVTIGDDFEIRLRLENTSMEVRKTKVAMTAKTAFYTGISAKDLKDTVEEVELAGGEEKSVVIPIMAADYLKHMVADACFKAFFKAKVLETGQSFATMETVDVGKPELEASFSTWVDIKRGEEFQMTFLFTNPLPFKLTNGVFHLENSRMEPRTTEKELECAVEPGEQASVTVTLKSKRRGRRYVEASFQSDQLSGVRGEFEVEIK